MIQAASASGWGLRDSRSPAADAMPGASLRVLLVEDNFLVGRSLRGLLRQMGVDVVGPIASLEHGLATLDRDFFHAAVLDMNILGGSSVPIARILQQRNTPFVFVTGYASPVFLPDDLRGWPRLAKPVDEAALTDFIRRARG